MVSTYLEHAKIQKYSTRLESLVRCDQDTFMNSIDGI